MSVAQLLKKPWFKWLIIWLAAAPLVVLTEFVRTYTAADSTIRDVLGLMGLFLAFYLVWVGWIPPLILFLTRKRRTQ